MTDLLVRRSAVMYGPNDKYRLSISRTWDDALPRLLWAGVNPSTADADDEDNTTHRWNHFARAWGFGGWDAVNMYPFRTPRPSECKRWYRESILMDLIDAMERNNAAVRHLVGIAAMVVPCWGNSPWDLNWTMQFAEMLCDHSKDGNLYCLGTNGDGSPRHPMARGRNRVPDDQRPILWRVR